MLIKSITLSFFFVLLTFELCLDDNLSGNTAQHDSY
uniref:Uncharacterized protein n=1 Tax=Anguilla anguilla TaxID=7936 RepID=A0A0E9SIR2_ANGAN